MEPFFTTKEPGKGTGLGLPMVHGLAEQSGGCFVLKSQKGKGTTAELWLPVGETGKSVTEQGRPLAPEAEQQHLCLLCSRWTTTALF